MARYREIPCKYYIAMGQCQKGRQGGHRPGREPCGKYEPRARVKCVNRKKQDLYHRRAKDIMKEVD